MRFKIVVSVEFHPVVYSEYSDCFIFELHSPVSSQFQLFSRTSLNHTSKGWPFPENKFYDHFDVVCLRCKVMRKLICYIKKKFKKKHFSCDLVLEVWLIFIQYLKNLRQVQFLMLFRFISQRKTRQ